MDSREQSNFLFQASGSHLLSESLVQPSYSFLGTGMDAGDMSISELSLADQTITTNKSLTHDDHHDHEDAAETGTAEDVRQAEHKKRHAAKLREDKLQSDLFVLKKLNASFTNFNEALQSIGSLNQRVAIQLEHTDALLNKYTGILKKSDQFSHLIFDEQWQGADADQELFERQMLEKAKREAEELALTAKREKEEQHRVEQALFQQKEKERIEQDHRQKVAIRGAVRGVRGTRASVRGTRGSSRIAPDGAGTSHRPTSSTTRTSNISKLPMPSAGVRSSSSRLTMRDSSRQT